MAELQTVNTPIHTISDGQIIENLDLHVASGDAITVTNDNVIIRNCRIHHQGGDWHLSHREPAMSPLRTAKLSTLLRRPEMARRRVPASSTSQPMLLRT